MSRTHYDAVIIGAGIVGCTVALHLRNRLEHVLVVEQEPDLLRRASYTNQARVHNGYHYPRSLLTALRSRVNAPRFIDEYRDCVDQTFVKVYAIGKFFSKVNARQFKAFCSRIGAHLERAPEPIRRLFNFTLIEEVFLAHEYAFNPVKLAGRLGRDLRRSGVGLRLNSSVVRIESGAGDRLNVHCHSPEDSGCVTAGEVFNCTYSALNRLLAASNLPLIPLQHEFTELALVEVPPHLQHVGITIMDGPFWSLMPFPARGLHTLSHVRYTPHDRWEDVPGADYVDGDQRARSAVRRTKYAHMIKDAQRYVPSLRECRYVESLWEVKTVLPCSDVDDSRPILFRRNHGLKHFTSVLGAKIDNIYDVLDQMAEAPVGTWQ